MKKACVIGWPISHSRSALIHNYWLKELAIEGSYETKAIETSEQAEHFITTIGQNNFIGCNVTLPFKQLAFHLVKADSEQTAQTGSVNTIFIRDGDIYGTSTDGEGYLDYMRKTVPNFKLKGATITIIGAGGAARALIAAFITQNAGEIRVLNRNEDNARALAHTFKTQTIRLFPWQEKASAIKSCDLLINTTPLGMVGQLGLDLPLDNLASKTIVSDIVYAPLMTKLLIEAQARGATIIDGLGMLLHQAVRGFELWFGTRPEVTPELRSTILKDLE